MDEATAWPKKCIVEGVEATKEVYYDLTNRQQVEIVRYI